MNLNSTLNRRAFLDAVLSCALSDSRFKICASYNWADPRQIMRVNIQENTINLAININTRADRKGIFKNNKHRGELQLLFCAYYIINYIHCLESAYTTVPLSYFNGLVVLESVLDLNSQKTILCSSPIAKGKPSALRPLDVYCTIRAINSVLMEKEEILTQEEKTLCEEAVDFLVIYTGVPEVMYAGGKSSRYSLLCDFLQGMALIERNPECISQFPLLLALSSVFSEDGNISEILRECDLRSDRFLAGMFVRLFAFTRIKGYLKKYLWCRCVCDAITDLQQSAEYWFCNVKETSPFVCDNSEAIKELLFMTDLVSGSYSDDKTGRPHFIQ
ncbi:MAG: hypothetical protein E7563_01720 [Ruminococcaceae bacterium]|nr:hypothetical protein [Oscillospiraceae bacterium]